MFYLRKASLLLWCFGVGGQFTSAVMSSRPRSCPLTLHVNQPGSEDLGYVWGSIHQGAIRSLQIGWEKTRRHDLDFLTSRSKPGLGCNRGRQCCSHILARHSAHGRSCCSCQKNIKYQTLSSAYIFLSSCAGF